AGTVRCTDRACERAAGTAECAADARRHASVDGSANPNRAVDLRCGRYLCGIRPHLRLPTARLGEPAEHAHQPAVRGRPRARPPACRGPCDAATDPGARRELADRGRAPAALARLPSRGLSYECHALSLVLWRRPSDLSW